MMMPDELQNLKDSPGLVLQFVRPLPAHDRKRLDCRSQFSKCGPCERLVGRECNRCAARAYFTSSTRQSCFLDFSSAFF
jgi:hypothetical protein